MTNNGTAMRSQVLTGGVRYGERQRSASGTSDGILSQPFVAWVRTRAAETYLRPTRADPVQKS